MTYEENYWKRLAERANPNDAVVKGHFYSIGPENPRTPRKYRGFGGDRYVVRFNDGRMVTSTNMWYAGTIPEQFRGQLPDNAEFVKEH